MPDCPVCGQLVRGSNLRRHMDSRHPDNRIRTLPELTDGLRKLMERNASDQEIADFLGLKMVLPSSPTVEAVMKSRSLAEKVLEAMMNKEAADVVDIQSALEHLRLLAAVVPAANEAVEAYEQFLGDSDSEDSAVDVGVSYDTYVEKMIALRHVVIPETPTPKLQEYERILSAKT